MQMVDGDGYGSDDATMTPPLPLDVMSQQMSQLSEMLPKTTATMATTSAAYRPAEQSQGTFVRGPKPKTVAGAGGRTGMKASAVVQTVDEIRKDSLRAMKKLPAGEAPTMWTLMTNLSQIELKTLCRYCGLQPSAKATKQDLGQMVLSAFQKGAFKSLFKVAASADTHRPPSVSQPGTSQQRQPGLMRKQPLQLPQTQTQTQTQTQAQLNPTHAHAHMPQSGPDRTASVAVVQLGGDALWRPADPGSPSVPLPLSSPPFSSPPITPPPPLHSADGPPCPPSAGATAGAA